jgi:acyl phosphate:glycerol-3-phosphate acyltransferase
MTVNLLVILVSYLLGSIPTALIVSRWRKGVDIRQVGDGNMGARNTFRSLGRRLGVIVALADILKGAFAVLLAKRLGLDLSWQCAAGVAAILGHDFPIFAQFKGGQGLATTFGTMLVLFPENALIGFGVYVVVFLISRNSNISAGVGFGSIALILWHAGLTFFLFYTVAALLFIPFKKYLDSHRVIKEEPDCIPRSPN